MPRSALSTDGEVDVNAPPDVLAVLDDGVDRNCRPNMSPMGSMVLSRNMQLVCSVKMFAARTLHDVVKTKLLDHILVKS